MAMFFALLPTDLQIDILQTWIGCADDGLKALSAMDTACCCKSLRSPFLSLTACVYQGCHVKESLAKLMSSNRFHWFQSRSVAIKELSHDTALPADADACMLLPTVAILNFSPRHGELATCLTTCPNMKSLHIACYLTDSDPSSAPKLAKIWGNDLTTCHPMQELHFKNCAKPCPPNLVQRALWNVGKLLMILVFMERQPIPGDENDGNLLLQALAENCHGLQKVQLSVPHGTADSVIGLMLANRELQDITLHYLHCSAEDMVGILVATEPHKKLKAFHCSSTTIPMDDANADYFVQMLARFPSLDSLEMYGCQYSRSTKRLELYRKPSPQDERIFAAVSPVKELWITFERDDDVSDWVGQRIGSHLTSLHCFLRDGFSSASLIAHCAQLMELITYDSVDDTFLLIVAKTCKQLQLVDFSGTITDLGVVALFVNCRLLTEVKLFKCTITFHSLQAILDNKLRLKMLSFTSDYVSAGDIERFKISAKELQLLPVPRIVM